MKTLLTLFEVTGTIGQIYADHGWNVIPIDIGLNDEVNGQDIAEIDTDWMYANIFPIVDTVDAIIAFPPCDAYTVSGAQWWPDKDQSGFTEKMIHLTKQVLRLVDLCQPDFWAIENPVGRIRRLVPDIGKPWYFEPWWFGDPYTKKTGIYGNFKIPHVDIKKAVIPVNSKTKESSLDYYWRVIEKVPFTKETRKYYRSKTPEGFAKAFYEANH